MILCVYYRNKGPLDIYSSGDEIYKKYGKDLIEEAIRTQVEECDYMQVCFLTLRHFMVTSS